MMFGGKYCKDFKPKLSRDGKIIKFVDSVKYLGVFLTDTLSDDFDIARQVKYLYAVGSSLRSKFHKCSIHQRWSRGHKARGQGQGHKKIRGQGQPFRGQTLSKDRNARGQGQGPRTQAQVLSKKIFTKIFQAISTKKRFPNNFSSAPQNFNNSKNSAVLEPRTGQFSRT